MTNIEFEMGCGNVYTDLDFPDAAEMKAKAVIVIRMRERVLLNKASMLAAAQIAGVRADELAKIFRGHFRQYSEAQIMEMYFRISSHWPAYPPDDGQLSPEYIDWLNEYAKENLPTGDCIRRAMLLPTAE